MSLFDRKPKMTVQEWCEDFYSSAVFASLRNGGDLWQTFCKSARDQVVQAAPSFSDVDAAQLADQLLALRLEVIAVAWMMGVRDRLSPKHSECTRKYLQTHDRGFLWDMMEPYNRTVAKATVGGSDPKTGVGRAHITYMNSMRAGLFDDWVATVSDPVDAGRAANRIGSAAAWKSGRMPFYLSCELFDQVQSEVNQPAKLILVAIIQGFFDGASEALRKVKIVTQAS